MKKLFAALLLSCALPGAVHAQQVDPAGRSVLEAVPTLKTGQFVWSPDAAPEGPLLLIVNLATQRAILFRNGVPIGASTVSTGKKGYETPTGVFTVLEKKKEHYSSTYNNAPMPNMQRLTWKGIALHAGKLPGYPASHGCIRLPPQFSSLLFGATQLGMTVVITSVPAAPRTAAPPEVAVSAVVTDQRGLEAAPFDWHPERAADGIVSVVVSSADQRALALRDGVEIGSAPVRVEPPLAGPIAYVLRASDESGRHWLKLDLTGSGEGAEIRAGEGRRFDAPTGFRSLVSDVLKPGSVVIVTPQPLTAASAGAPLTVIENGEN